MKTYTIAPVHRLTVAGAGVAYLTTFAALWLFVEPLGAFGLIPSLAVSSGVFIYAGLLLVPALALPGVLRWYRWYKTHHLPYVKLTIRSAADGATYSLKVAENMQVSELLRQYIEILRRGPARDQVESMTQRYYAVLQVKRDSVFVDVDGNLTVHVAGLNDGDDCQVRAEEYPHLNQIMFSLG